MMTTVLVSLVSEQTIPNIMLIEELKKKIDRYMFITTNNMEVAGKSRSGRIIEAAGIERGNCTTIYVKPNSIDNVLRVLNAQDFSRENKYIVNITGGTKPMAIAAMSFFSEIPQSRIIYSYINSNSFHQISPKVNHPETVFSTKLTLNQYLLAYGLKLINNTKQLGNPVIAEKTFLRCMNANNNLNKLPEIKFAQRKPTSKERAFYSGGWFEEYIYYIIKKQFQLDDCEIAMGVKLASPDAGNEFDVVFVYQHNIHIVECKAYFGKVNIRKKIEEGLYKLGALNDKFGIKAKSYFLTNFDLLQHNPSQYNSLMQRAKDLNVHFGQMKELINNEFVKWIKQ
jgi:hypothetical protein